MHRHDVLTAWFSHCVCRYAFRVAAALPISATHMLGLININSPMRFVRALVAIATEITRHSTVLCHCRAKVCVVTVSGFGISNLFIVETVCVCVCVYLQHNCSIIIKQHQRCAVRCVHL